MKNWVRKLILVTSILLLLVTSGLALDIQSILPFSKDNLDNYYIRYRIKIEDSPIEGFDHLEYRVYFRDGLTSAFTIVPLHDGRMHEYQFDFQTNQNWVPKPDIGLFLRNYELRITGIASVANREAVSIDVIDKRTGQKVITYVIDAETSLILNQYEYDKQGNEIRSYETLEVDYNPDFSKVKFNDQPVVGAGMSYTEITKEKFLSYLPWLNLGDLPLPEGFEFIAFAKAKYDMSILEETYLKQKYPDTPITHLSFWISDGLRQAEVMVAFIEGKTASNNYSIEILETSPENYSMIVVSEANTVISVRSDFLSQEEQVELLKSFVVRK